MTAVTDFYIPSSWRFKQATLLLAAHFVAVSLIQAPVSMAQSACNTSGSGENQPQQQCPQAAAPLFKKTYLARGRKRLALEENTRNVKGESYACTKLD